MSRIVSWLSSTRVPALETVPATFPVGMNCLLSGTVKGCGTTEHLPQKRPFGLPIWLHDIYNSCILFFGRFDGHFGLSKIQPLQTRHDAHVLFCLVEHTLAMSALPFILLFVSDTEGSSTRIVPPKLGGGIIIVAVPAESHSFYERQLAEMFS